MFNSLNEIIGYKIQATDDDLGKLDEVYFDDETWFVRYLIVQTGKFLADRRVLISTVVSGKPDHVSKHIPVSLTSERVRNSPDIDTKKPVYRQHEEELNAYYDWPTYWQGSMAGLDTYVMPPVYPPIADKDLTAPNLSDTSSENDPHLRSSRHIKGYNIQAFDGEIGHVDDFIIDDEIWRISYMVVKTRNWLPGKRVLISPQWIKEINWAEDKVYVDLTRDDIIDSPEFEPSELLNAEYIHTLKKHYQEKH